jgi:hypothetical protein
VPSGVASWKPPDNLQQWSAQPPAHAERCSQASRDDQTGVWGWTSPPRHR